MRALPVLSLVSAAAAQLYNGQYFTRGLAIIDAPNPGSPYNAGSNMPIAVDVSGDGQLGTHDDTAIRSLTAFLVSSPNNVNFSVAPDAAFLTGEAGSTVKHLDFAVPACVPAGAYNLTFYESYTYQGTAYFSVTPLPVEIKSTTSATCSTAQPTQPETQPQPDAALAASPFLPGGAATATLPNGVPRQGISWAMIGAAFGLLAFWRV